MNQPPELETLDQLLGGDQALSLVRRHFETEARFIRAIAAMLESAELRLLEEDGTEVPRWRWRDVLAATSGPAGQAEYRLSITDLGARRVG